MTERNNIQDIQIATLTANQESTSKKVDCLSDKVDQIMTNHLYHIKEDLAKLSANQKILLWFMFAMLGGIVALYFK
jgi:hypothetical protein